MRINQIKTGALLNYVIIGLNTVVGLLYTPYMLRCLGQNEYGIYSLVASIIAYLTLLDFGFGNAIIRYTAKYRAEGKSDEQWHMFGMFLIVYCVIGLIALAGGLVLYYNVDALFDHTMTPSDLSQAKTMMLLLTFNLAVTFPLSIFGSIISAYENFVFQRLISIARIVLSTAVMILVLNCGYKAIALVVVQTVFNVLTLLINVIYCKSKLKIHIRFGQINILFLKEITIYSFWIFLNAIMDKLYWGTGQFVLGAISGTTAVAIFSVAILLQQMYMTFSSSISSVLLPKVTSMVTTHSSDKNISDLFIKTGRLQFQIMGFILAGFVVFGKGFIHLWAGQGYSESYIITIIFFASLIIPLIQNTGIVILQARNQMKFRSLLYLAISLTSLVFQIYLSRKYGATGCALSIGGALLIGQGVIMNIYYNKKQHIDIPLFWHEILKISIIPTILMLIGIFTWNISDYTNPLQLILGMFTFTLAYMFLLWNFGMNTYEKQLFITPLKRFSTRFKH